MTTAPSVSFIGSGNLAWHLAPALDNAGFVVREVYSRNPKHAAALTGRLYQAEVKATLDFSTSNSRFFFIAVSDDAIESVVRDIILPEDACLVHTSGSQPLEILNFAAIDSIGVFYPLQTFSKSKKIDFKEVPIFIEANNPNTEQLLSGFAKSISKRVTRIASEERKALHVAAVFAANFTNHMLTISKKILEENSLSFDLLKPLIQETITKSLSVGPENSQTGPASRGDLEVLDRHLSFLQESPEWAEIYKLVSQHIIDTYQSE